ncbi:MAG: transglutaminase-like domain-containing protein [Lachnospiraceae bacterium]|nr:transglutaminase-like domain-containing protein [Lachnospiraceae bacterium]
MNINDTFRYLNIGLPEDILRRKLYGDFAGAIRLIDRRLAMENTPKALRCCLIAQREMMLRMPEDYPYTREDALNILRKHIPDFTEEEFDERVDAGKIGWIYVNGEMHFFNRFFPTMCKADPAFAIRAGATLTGVESAVKGSKEEGRLDRCMRIMRENGSIRNRIRIRASMRIKDECFIPGMFVRAHLPIPAACEQQSEIRIEKVFPVNGQIAPVDALQRTICWEENMAENHEFIVEYSYIHKATYHDLSRQKQSETQSDSRFEEKRDACIKDQPQFFTQEEAPHIIFTPYIRELAASLTEGITDQLEKARRFYDFITLNMKYTFMPAYFSLESIPEVCARNFTGDCGVFALLFLTLCRCVGIPARWQSGLTAEPDFCGGHDWVQFYVAPYGWLYADTSYGTAAVRAGNEERRKFYFGNLDAYRMVCNNAFQAPFTVDKKQWRADPYDNQVGEIETADRGLRYEEFDRSKVVLMCEEI